METVQYRNMYSLALIPGLEGNQESGKRKNEIVKKIFLLSNTNDIETRVCKD